MYSAKISRLKKKGFRDAFVKSHLAHGLAHQIRILRLEREWSQGDLAEKLGVKGQSTVARMEDPSYGKLSIRTLLKLSSVFDVALSVKFESFSTFLLEHDDLSPRALKAESFENDSMLSVLETEHRYSQLEKLKSHYGNQYPIHLTIQSPREVANDLLNGDHKTFYIGLNIASNTRINVCNASQNLIESFRQALPRKNTETNILETRVSICQNAI
ncbi:helix-turn-helix transcriptional regulator [Methylomonas sp. 2BW1-5-20]|uniref:helix-turn-helix transcriptional regulator n=1 Tax=Methylomonas sp. 2BW1-5-20 TaxID=3376686 RepID=UPI00404EE627